MPEPKKDETTFLIDDIKVSKNEFILIIGSNNSNEDPDYFIDDKKVSKEKYEYYTKFKDYIKSECEKYTHNILNIDIDEALIYSISIKKEPESTGFHITSYINNENIEDVEKNEIFLPFYSLPELIKLSLNTQTKLLKKC